MVQLLRRPWRRGPRGLRWRPGRALRPPPAGRPNRVPVPHRRVPVAARAAFRRGLKRSAPALLLLLAAGALDVLTVRHDTLTEDEPVHYRYGVNVLDGDSTRFDDSKMPATALNALPARVGTRLRPG